MSAPTPDSASNDFADQLHSRRTHKKNKETGHCLNTPPQCFVWSRLHVADKTKPTVSRDRNRKGLSGTAITSREHRRAVSTWCGGQRSYRSTNMGPARAQTRERKSRSNQTKTERRYYASLIASNIVSDETGNRHTTAKRASLITW